MTRRKPRKTLPLTGLTCLFWRPDPLDRTTMAYISYVSRADADGELSRQYRGYTNKHGVVDNILRIHSLNPPSMRHHAQMYEHLMRGASPLSPLQREMIAVLVSGANDCFY